MPTTTRGALRYPLLADTPDVPRDIQNLANDVASLVAFYGQGTLAARPTSTGGTPGVQGRHYYATDTGHFYYDFGTGWTDIGPVSAGIPADSITAVEIAPDAVGASELADNSVAALNIIDGVVGIAEIAAALKPSQGAAGATEALRALGTAAGTAAPGIHGSQHSRTGADPVVIGTWISSGTLAARPSTSLVAGMVYTATDTAGGTSYMYNGAAWVQIAAAVSSGGVTAHAATHLPGGTDPIHKPGTSGLLAARPVAAAANDGQFYWATDQVVLYLSVANAWVRIGEPAGACVIWNSTIIPAGYVVYDGTALPASTGIYADLFAHLGSVTKINLAGKVPVGLDAVDGDFDLMGELRGAKTHTLVIGEIPSHSHTEQTYTGSADTGTAGTFAAAANNTATQASGAAGGGGAHNNLQPSRVVHFIAKL